MRLWKACWEISLIWSLRSLLNIETNGNLSAMWRTVIVKIVFFLEKDEIIYGDSKAIIIFRVQWQ